VVNDRHAEEGEGMKMVGKNLGRKRIFFFLREKLDMQMSPLLHFGGKMPFILGPNWRILIIGSIQASKF